jgi:hypothetical protein
MCSYLFVCGARLRGMTENLAIGGLDVSVENAKKLARQYMHGPGIWSYPAYDRYPGNGDPDSVGPQDFLAAGLLNAGQKPLKTQYTFEDLSEDINTRLANIPQFGTLDRADDATLKAIADLFGVLDRKKPTPAVRLTKLSKVLHLKRPGLLPLYDDHVFRAYCKLGTVRVEPVLGRSWKDFALVWLPEIRQDLRDGLQHWRETAARRLTRRLTPSEGDRCSSRAS